MTIKETNQLKLLYFALPSIQKRLQAEIGSENPDKDVVFELGSTVQFVIEHFGSTMTRLRELPKSYIEFDILWTIYPKHIMVHGSDQLGQDQVYRVKQSGYGKNQDGSVFFSIYLEYLDSNGKQLGYVIRGPQRIDSFHGSRLIFDLPVVPFESQPHYEKLREELVLRGEKILRLHGRHLQDYQGHAVEEDERKEKTYKKFNVSHVLPAFSRFI